jgi:hypothetical protein
MQATEELDDARAKMATKAWLKARDHALNQADSLAALGVHKQVANRLLEPFMWVDVVATATDWANFFALRCHDAAQPEMQKLAVMMARAYRDSKPAQLEPGQWHLPYVSAGELATLHELEQGNDQATAESFRETLIKFSVARCARVSYKPHDSDKPDREADLRLYDQLLADKHMSPFEHQGHAVKWGPHDYRSGNFVGWFQYRQGIRNQVHTTFDFAALDKFDQQPWILKSGACRSDPSKPS